MCLHVWCIELCDIAIAGDGAGERCQEFDAVIGEPVSLEAIPGTAPSTSEPPPTVAATQV